jgi:AcrR family transcriptional regulator
MNVHSRCVAAFFSAPTARIPTGARPIMTFSSRVIPPGSAEERVLEILEKLRPVFVEKGFDGASMQDLARAAGMSVGNFYRYFPSKSAIVEAMIGIDLRELEAMFALILQSDDPMQRFREAVRLRITQQDCEGEGQLWAEITAAAMRKAEIGEAARRMEEGVLHNLCCVFAAATGQPLAEVRARHQTEAEFILILVKGMSMRHCSVTAPQYDNLVQLVLRKIDAVLDEITEGHSARTAKVTVHA